MVVLLDRFQIENLLAEDIEFRQPENAQHEVLPRRCASSLVFSTSHDQSSLQVRIAGKGWRWSYPIPTTKEMNEVIQTVNLDSDEIAYIAISVHVAGNVVRITLGQGDPIYRIENHSSNNLKFHQKDTTDSAIELWPKQQSRLAWTSLLRSRELSLHAQSIYGTWHDLGCYHMDDEEFAHSEAYTIVLRSDGVSRVLEVHDQRALNSVLAVPSKAMGTPLQINCNLSRLNVLISTDSPKVLLSFKGILAAYSSVEGKEEIHIAAESIAARNLDTSANFANLMIITPATGSSSCVRLEMSILARIAVGICFEHIDCQLCPLTLNFHGLDMLILLDNLSQSYKHDTSRELSVITPVCEALSAQLKLLTKKLKAPAFSKLVTIKHLKISALPLRVTLRSPLSKLQTEEFPHIGLLAFLLVQLISNALASFDSSMVEFRELKVTEFWGTERELIRVISTHYNFQILESFTQMLASLSILGAPLQSFVIVGGALIDLLHAPFSSTNQLVAMINTLNQSGALISACAGSMTFSLGRLSSSLNAGLLSTELGGNNDLSMRRRSPPVALLAGVGAGFHGMISEPVKGYEQHGVRGALLGVIKGAAGMLITPTSSVLSSLTSSLDNVSSNLIPRHLNPLHSNESIADHHHPPSEIIPQENAIQPSGFHLIDDACLEVISDRVHLRTDTQSTVLFSTFAITTIDVSRTGGFEEYYHHGNLYLARRRLDEKFLWGQMVFRNPLYNLSVMYKSSADGESSTKDFLFASPKEAQRFLRTLAGRGPDISLSDLAAQFMMLEFAGS